MEQALINEGIPVEEISRLCDVHAAVFRDAPVSDSPERIFTGPRTCPPRPAQGKARQESYARSARPCTRRLPACAP